MKAAMKGGCRSGMRRHDAGRPAGMDANRGSGAGA